MLEIGCGTSVSQSTIWRTLRRAGFTMKKVSGSMFFQHMVNSNAVSPSSPALQLSDLQKSVLTILRGLARTLRSNLSLLMSPLSIAEQHTEVVRGLFVEPKLSGRLFLCVDDGMSEVLNSKH